MDSGVGGLPYLETARVRIPNAQYVYFCDSASFPYGEKDSDEVRNIVLNAASILVRTYNPAVLVIACNTASQIVLPDLRARFPGIPVVGTVPAVKPAARLSLKRRIGLLSTRRTSQDPYLEELVKDWAADCRIIRRAAPELVDFVEKKYLSSSHEERLDLVRPLVKQMIDEDVDVIILGCTHFLFLEKEIMEAAEGKAVIVDSREGVAMQAKRMMEKLEPGMSGKKTRDIFIHSGPTTLDPHYAAFARLFKLQMMEMPG